MKVFENNYTKTGENGCVLALGCFDGVHLGHQYLLSEAKKYAKDRGLEFGVYTFSTIPKFKHASHSLIMGNTERLSKISYFSGCDFVYCENFELVKDMTETQFVDYIVEKFDCKCTFCGENFFFGKGAVGNSDSLCTLMRNRGGDAVVVECLKMDGREVSSTFIRDLLRSGDVSRAKMLLGGEPYGFVSRVVHGANIGHTLGFPTINQIIPDVLVVPKNGVYATIVVIDGVEYKGVTNFGTKPTVSEGSDEKICETYIVDFDGDIYEKYVGVYFYKMLREEIKFSSLEELKKNISLNVEQTKIYFEDKNEKI